MLSYDSGDADTIAEELTDAMKGVITGTVTQAVRDASLNGINIHENDYIGFTGKNMLAAAKNKNDAALALLEKLEAGNHEFMIALYGAAMEDVYKRQVFLVYLYFTILLNTISFL